MFEKQDMVMKDFYKQMFQSNENNIMITIPVTEIEIGYDSKSI